MSSYKVKEMFYSLQGEGARAGRPAVFCRFSKCNLWNGREQSRTHAICQFCDTDILGTDGQNGGEFTEAEALAKAITKLWPQDPLIAGPSCAKPYVVFTGGEPALQLDAALIKAMHQRGFEVAIETNGTLALPAGIDWICLSPKAEARIAIARCDELKLVYPQDTAPPERFTSFPSTYYFLSPMADPLFSAQQHMQTHTQAARQDSIKAANTQAALNYCLQHPQWRLTLQLHKLLDID